ncbi:MAG: cyclic nucleotide-binding domain-containing protein [Acidimicrobiia bacterium]
MTDVREALRSVPLFSALTNERLDKVAGLVEEVHHPPGHVIVQEGLPAHGFHLLIDGQVDVSSGGHPRRTLGPGSFFGELALIDEGKRSASVTASSPITVLVIEGTRFRELLHDDPETAFQLLVYLAGLVRSAEQRGG